MTCPHQSRPKSRLMKTVALRCRNVPESPAALALRGGCDCTDADDRLVGWRIGVPAGRSCGRGYCCKCCPVCFSCDCEAGDGVDLGVEVGVGGSSVGMLGTALCSFPLPVFLSLLLLLPPDEHNREHARMRGRQAPDGRYATIETESLVRRLRACHARRRRQ